VTGPSSADAARAHELAEHVIAPLVLGGALRPVRPLGPRRALAIGDLGIAVLSDERRLGLAAARLRAARRLAPVDVLPDVAADEVALAAALSDLLQVTNHELSGVLTRRRHDRLLAAAVVLVDLAGPPRTLGRALARHATFARVPELVRVDSTVAWWTGSRSFRGQPPPARLLAWPDLRRVSVARAPVPVEAMADDAPVDPSAWVAALGRWLARTPLTDLASSHRRRPAFAWSEATLGLVADPGGARLALRAIGAGAARRPDGTNAAAEAVARATAALEVGSHARSIADAFARELVAAIDTLWA
jgi:hypothetical protein